MQPDQQDAAELIRSGQYYEQARRWYATLYINPISERSVFILIGLLAAATTLIGLLAVSALLPLADKPGLIIGNARQEATYTALIPLRRDGETVNQALRKFMVIQYVFSRESYANETALRNSAFVLAHSDAATSAEFAALVGPENPQSPSNLLGALGRRLVKIQSVDISGWGETQTARVTFSTEIVSVTSLSKTQWTATMQFHYSDAVEKTTTDPSTGEEKTTLTEPSFQVIRYEAVSRP